MNEILTIVYVLVVLILVIFAIKLIIEGIQISKKMETFLENDLKSQEEKDKF